MTPTDAPEENHALLVPGLGLTTEAWAPTVRALVGRGADAGALEITHLPGYGDPARRTDDLSPRILAERLLDRSPERGLVLFGHSASCQVVARAAATDPERVRALVLVGPTTDPRAATWPRLARRWLATAAHEPPGQLPVLLRSYTRTGLGAMARGMDAARRDRLDRVLADVRVPVLLLRGPYDRIAPADWLDRLAGQDRSRRRALTLARGGHMVPLVEGGLVAAAVPDLLPGLHVT